MEPHNQQVFGLFGVWGMVVDASGVDVGMMESGAEGIGTVPV